MPNPFILAAIRLLSSDVASVARPHISPSDFQLSAAIRGYKAGNSLPARQLCFVLCSNKTKSLLTILNYKCCG